MNGQGWWYLARASGLIAWALLGLSAALGLLVSARWTPRRSRAWFVDLHRGLAGLGCAAVGLHLYAIVADSFEEFDLLDLVIPMRSDLSPGAMAWGIAALYLLVAVQATSLAVRRVPYGVWRRVHYGGLAIFWLATIHGLLAGTDDASPYVRTSGVVAMVATAALSFRRLHRGSPRLANDSLS